MTIPELLKAAQALAAEGHVDAKHIAGLAESASKAEVQIAMCEVSIEDYERATAARLAGLDGSGAAYERWSNAQQLLTSTRSEHRLLMEGLFFIREEVERQIALGRHAKAKAAREEARA